MIFIEPCANKVDVANTWVMYIQINNIPAHLQMKKTNFNYL